MMISSYCRSKMRFDECASLDVDACGCSRLCICSGSNEDILSSAIPEVEVPVTVAIAQGPVLEVMGIEAKESPRNLMTLS